MYDVALTVQACLRAGTQVDIAWVVDGDLPASPVDALALTPGGGRVGNLLSGALDAQLADRAASGGTDRLVRLTVSEVDALVAGLPASGGEVRCLLVAAAGLPGDLWDLLRTRTPVGLVSRLDGDQVTGTELFTADDVAMVGAAAVTALARGTSTTTVTSETVTTVLCAVPKLVVVGAGPFADALVAAARVLGWATHATTERAEATGLAAGLSSLDQLVVAGHDDNLTGAALEAALATPVGYLGGLGPQRVHQSRAEWLAGRGLTDLRRLHAPAGLDIGARTPGEVAVAVLAEAIAVRAGRSVGVLATPPAAT